MHTHKVFAGESKDASDAFYLLRRIKRYGQRQVMKQKMWQGIKTRFKDAQRLDEILKLLEERGYLRIEKVATGGRPAECIKINPLVFGDMVFH